MTSRSILVSMVFLLGACNGILGIPEVELSETPDAMRCTNPTAPAAGYGTVNLNPTATAVNDVPTRITFRANLDNATRPDRLQLELFDGSSFGAAGAQPAVGTYDLTGTEISYETCGICARIFTDTDLGGIGVDVYMARQGTLRLTNVTGRLAGSLENVVLRHVNITAPNFTTTNHPDGCETTIGRADFDIPLVDGGSLDAL